MNIDSTPATAAQVAILAFPEVTASVVFGMYDLFKSAGRDWGFIVDGVPGRPPIEPQVVSAHRGAFEVANGVQVRPQATLDGPPPDVVCVPEMFVPPGEPLEGRFTREIDWLRRCHASGSIVAATCSGALLLAEAGLLDGHEATTHWAYCDIMARRYPRVTVRPQRSLVVSGEGQRLMMAGGGTSWIDMALYLIARLAGVEAAMQVARLNLVDWHHVGQQPFARLSASRQADDALIARCQAWIAENYQRSAPVAAMTQLSGLPERSFVRRFHAATGMSPLEYVHTLRLEEAKQMLEASDASIEAIAHEVGYEDAAFFSRLFRRKVNLTPAQYRRRFRGLRQAVQGNPASLAREALAAPFGRRDGVASSAPVAA
jgi:transcriptional regulator GlxA family with amidase domain